MSYTFEIGAVIAESAYDNQYGFTGRYLDAETGLWYFRARYFSTEMGRFVSRDPLGYVDGMSMYAGYFAQYFEIDPTGHATAVPRPPRGYSTNAREECQKDCASKGGVKSLVNDGIVGHVMGPKVYTGKRGRATTLKEDSSGWLEVHGWSLVNVYRIFYDVKEFTITTRPIIKYSCQCKDTGWCGYMFGYGGGVIKVLGPPSVYTDNENTETHRIRIGQVIKGSTTVGPIKVTWF